MPYGGAPATVPTDELKFLVGDQSTSSATELLSTAECNYLIARYGSAKAAAPHGARAIAADFAEKVSKAVGDLRLEAQQAFEHYETLAKSLRLSVSLTASPFAGGISIADKQSVEQDSDRVMPAFRVGLHDNPATSTST